MGTEISQTKSAWYSHLIQPAEMQMEDSEDRGKQSLLTENVYNQVWRLDKSERQVMVEKSKKQGIHKVLETRENHALEIGKGDCS